MTAFIPLWILPSSFSALAAGAFCIQFGVQGAWGVVSVSILDARHFLDRSFSQIPIQLAEMSPPAFRATFPGVSYQLGNVRCYQLPGDTYSYYPQMVSSASAQIEASTFSFFSWGTDPDAKNSCGKSPPDDHRRERCFQTRCRLCHRPGYSDRCRGCLRGHRDHPGPRVCIPPLFLDVRLIKRRIETTPRTLRSTRLLSKRAEDRTTPIWKMSSTHAR